MEYLNKIELMGDSLYLNATDIRSQELIYLLSHGWELSINYNNINMSFIHILAKQWEV